MPSVIPRVSCHTCTFPDVAGPSHRHQEDNTIIIISSKKKQLAMPTGRLQLVSFDRWCELYYIYLRDLSKLSRRALLVGPRNSWLPFSSLVLKEWGLTRTCLRHAVAPMKLKSRTINPMTVPYLNIQAPETPGTPGALQLTQCY